MKNLVLTLGFMFLNLQTRSEAHQHTHVIKFHACEGKNLELAEQELSSGLDCMCLNSGSATCWLCNLERVIFFSPLNPNFLIEKMDRIIISTYHCYWEN